MDNNHVQPSLLTGDKMIDVSLTATPRTAIRNIPFALSGIDAAYCYATGVTLFSGSIYYHYQSVTIMILGKIAPVPNPITSEMMGCQA